MTKTSIMLAAITASLFHSAAPANASANCLRGQRPFELKQDIVSWSMKLTKGSDCIQGLRWSYMQIYQVSVATPPQNGRLLIVGSGFRYYADVSSNAVTDRFTLTVSGKNRHDLGTSTIEVLVEPNPEAKTATLVAKQSQSDSD